MPAGTYNFTIEQGETFSRVITWNDSSNSPINLTGYTARMQIRKGGGAPELQISLTTGGGGIVLGGVAGTITITIPASDTATMDAKSYVYDLELVSGSGVVTKLLKGIVSVAREVTV
ncbi:MAG: hypothetical protein E6R03_09740 [Hyphomicrobiaceae bacterium]|nr:MAG: hypothetical protein E6R03_09740 [Hyphomicrobiaceae bacterium]